MSLLTPDGAHKATTSPTSVTIEQISAYLDLLISLHLHAWPALTLAIQNAWGGSPQVSRDKRDWFAGAVSELLLPDPRTQKAQIAYLDDLEEVLLQVMLDEFEVVVDDGSAGEVAQKIWKGREAVFRGEFDEVEELRRVWEEKRAKGEQAVGIRRVDDQDGNETDWDDDDDGDEEEWNGFQDEDGDDDEQMDEAPPLVDARKNEKVEPEVDEDGFTKVVGRRKR